MGPGPIRMDSGLSGFFRAEPRHGWLTSAGSPKTAEFHCAQANNLGLSTTARRTAGDSDKVRAEVVTREFYRRDSYEECLNAARRGLGRT